MRKLFLLTCLIFFFQVNAQISLSFKSTNNLYLDKFHISGYKFVLPDLTAKKIYIFNLNNTLYKTLNIPVTTYTLIGVSYVSENLFDLDNGMEYLLRASNSSSGSKLFVCDETGPILWSRDSAQLSYQYRDDTFENDNIIFFDGTGAKMKIFSSGANKYEFYNLPGTIPCKGCSSGIINSVASGGGNEVLGDEASFYPNPATDQLKLRYQLPPGWKSAKIKIFDINGKLVEDFNITDFFDFIFLPTNYNNGMYVYSLIVDDKIIKNEKIVLVK